MGDERLLTVKEAAEFLGYKPSTIYAKAIAKILPHVVLWQGKRKDAIRFSRSELEAFVRRQSVGVAVTDVRISNRSYASIAACHDRLAAKSTWRNDASVPSRC